ncbi:GNAT family N-acetyltransferase [Candidatus Altiarchaeota archaeon]
MEEVIDQKELVIRQSQQDDLGRCIEILDEYWGGKPGYERERIRRYISLKHQEGRLFVATVNFRVAGVMGVRYQFSENVYYVEELTVKEEYRNLNIGSSLLNYIKNQTAKGHLKGIFLDVSPKNTEAQKFYRNQGFREVGSIEGLRKRSEKQIIYAWFNE